MQKLPLHCVGFGFCSYLEVLVLAIHSWQSWGHVGMGVGGVMLHQRLNSGLQPAKHLFRSRQFLRNLD